MKKTVVLRAASLSLSGYGEHSRQIFKWLLKKDKAGEIDLITQIVPWGITPWHINENNLDGIAGEIMKRSQGMTLSFKPDVSIQVQLPNEWESNFANKNVGISAFVETDICNPAWIDNTNKMTHIVVPSQHVKTTAQKSGTISVPFSVIPESFHSDICQINADLDLKIDTTFNFLVVGQLTGNNIHNDRKNIYATIKWICEVFANDPSVGIIIKTNSGTGTSIDRIATVKTINTIVQAVRKGSFPKIHLLHGNLSNKEVSSLYNRHDVKALVSLTRGEGYGLPILEAAAAALPVIVTNWSGHLDFMNQGRFIPINYELRDIHQTRIDNKIFIKGAKWAEPDENDFKKKIKKFRDSPAIPVQWAKELGAKIREKYSQDAIEQEYDNALGYLL